MTREAGSTALRTLMTPISDTDTPVATPAPRSEIAALAPPSNVALPVENNAVLAEGLAVVQELRKAVDTAIAPTPTLTPTFQQ